jgi:hypothetical protein
MPMEFSSAIKFLPWVGVDYEAHPGWPGKLLLLGEAHYADSDNQPNLTREVIERQWNGETYPYFTRLAQVMTGKPHVAIDKEQFWSSVAFYNVIQRIVAQTARVPPSEDQWDEGQRVFPEIIDILEPDYIIVTADRLWSKLPEWSYSDPLLFEGRPWQTCSSTTSSGHSFRATYIHHPSSGGFGSYQRWHALVRAFLQSK